MTKRTPLFHLHKQLNARMVEFAGWEMPVQYTSVREEHVAVRTKCGIFDVSHMGKIVVRGPKAESIVQRLACNDASRLKPGESQYSALLTERGTFVDDIIVNRLGPELFLLCVNASNAEKDFEWVRPHATNDTTIEDRSHDYSQIAIQGPEAIPIVRAYCPTGTSSGRNTPLPERPFTLLETELAYYPVILSRTGYTGEDGFEIYAGPGDAEKIWTLFREKGGCPCGLAARDTLRLEAALPLYGHEIDDSTHPFEAGLGWIVKMDKGDFIGRDALRAQQAVPLQRKLVGIEMTEPGIARQGCKIFDGDGENQIGIITSGTKSPFLDKAIAMGYVAADFMTVNTKIAVDIHNKKRHGNIVSLPFCKRKK